MRFTGSDYVHDRDAPRLTSQLLRVWDVMADGRWRGLAEISAITGDPPASVSAQLRHLRKARFGGHTVEKQYISSGYFKYRLVTKEMKFDFLE